MDRINITLNEAGQRLDRFLRKYLKDMALSEIYKLLRKNAVRVNGKRAKENYRLNEGDVLELSFGDKKAEVEEIKPAGRDFSIVYEDDNILLADKPPGMIYPERDKASGKTFCLHSPH
jgi:23S rRNA pseudouridine955/2504/2580 synthase